MKKYIILALLAMLAMTPAVYAANRTFTTVSKDNYVAQVITVNQKVINVERFTDPETGVNCYYSEVNTNGQLFVNCVK